MPWFKVDDNLYSHPKFRRAGMAAMGLWLAAGAWSASHLTDGFVPNDVIGWLGGTPAQRKKLISAGLWIEEPDGCRFHDWNEWQPTRGEVAQQRAAWRARKQKSRTSMANDTHFDYEQSSENLENPEEAQVSGGGHAHVPPSRPVPTRPIGQEPPSESLVGRPALALAVQPPLLAEVATPAPSAPAKPDKARGSRLAEDWRPTDSTMLWSREQAQASGLDINGEWAKFQDYWLSKPGAAARKLDWDRTWRNWLRTALERRPHGRPAGRGPTRREERAQQSMDLIAKYERLDAEEREASLQRKAIQA